MRLSVIMPVYNREQFVGLALRSLLRQREDIDLDIIVIDDGSTDGSAAVIRSLIDEAPCIRLFQQINGGVTKARNAGLKQLLPQTRLVSFLDLDDISPIGRFKADLACFEEDPGLDLTYSRMTLIDKIDGETLEPAADSHSITVRGSTCPPGSSRETSSSAPVVSTKISNRPRTPTICCVSLRARQNTLCPIRWLSITGVIPAT